MSVGSITHRRRRSPIARRLAGLAAMSALSCALGAFATRPAAAEPPAPPPAARAQAEALPSPNLEGMDRAVVDQLERTRAGLDAALTRGDAPAAELAAAYGRLGQLYLLYQLYDASEAALARAEAAAPDDPRWPYYRGAVAQETGRLDAAAEHFERFLELRPDDLPGLLHLGQAQVDRNRPDEAERIFTRALAIDPTSVAATEGLAQVDSLRGDFARSVERFEAVLEAQPEATLVHYQLGLAYRELGDLDRARDHLGRRGTQRVRFDDPLLEALGALARGRGIFLVEGNRAYAKGDYELAVAAYRRAVEEDPEDRTARSAYASALARSGRDSEAVEQFRRILEAERDDVVSHFNLGTLLLQGGEIEEGLEHLRRAVEIDPAFIDGHFNLATSYEGLGRWKDAVEQYTRVLELDPQDTNARLRRARILDRAGRPEEAEAELTAVARAQPDDPAIQLALGTLLGRKGKYRSAAEHLGRAVELAPDDEEAHFGRAMALMLGGFDREAAERLTESAAALPESVPIQHLLARLRAASADPEVRDGERAVTLAQKVLDRERTFEHAETLAMALAAAGSFAEAAGIERRVVEQMRASGRADVAAQERRLAAYERGEPVRSPWKPPA